MMRNWTKVVWEASQDLAEVLPTRIHYQLEKTSAFTKNEFLESLPLSGSNGDPDAQTSTMIT